MSSSATNRSKLDMNSCLELLTNSSIIHKQGIIGILRPRRVQLVYDVILRHDRFSAILVYDKNLQNVSPITDFVQSSRNLAEWMFGLNPTKPIQQIPLTSTLLKTFAGSSSKRSMREAVHKNSRSGRLFWHPSRKSPSTHKFNGCKNCKGDIKERVLC